MKGKRSGRRKRKKVMKIAKKPRTKIRKKKFTTKRFRELGEIIASVKMKKKVMKNIKQGKVRITRKKIITKGLFMFTSINKFVKNEKKINKGFMRRERRGRKTRERSGSVRGTIRTRKVGANGTNFIKELKSNKRETIGN